MAMKKLTIHTVAKIAVALAVITIIVAGGMYWFTQTKHAPSPTPTPSVGSSAQPTTAVNTACQSKNLAASLISGSGAAGTYYYTLALKNTGDSSCTYSGNTTISLFDSNDFALGSPDSDAITKDLTIGKGKTIYSVVGFPNRNNFASQNCSPGVVTLAIYPPTQITPVRVTGLDTLNKGFTDYFCPGFSAQAFSLTKP